MQHLTTQRELITWRSLMQVTDIILNQREKQAENKRRHRKTSLPAVVIGSFISKEAQNEIAELPRIHNLSKYMPTVFLQNSANTGASPSHQQLCVRESQFLHALQFHHMQFLWFDVVFEET